MGEYTCIKSATFAGVKYKPGDTVPAGAIPANRVDAVIRLGLIAKTQQAAPVAPAAPAEPAPVTIPITMGDGGVEQLEAAPETIVEAITTLQMNAENAIAHIAGITDAAALILIDACDTRKTVKKAAADRAAELETADAAQSAPQSDADTEAGKDTAPDENAAQGGQGGAESGE